jgi:hypothetical protein
MRPPLCMEGNMGQEAEPADLSPLGSEGRDGAFDFARRVNSGESDTAAPSVEQILAEMPEQFRTAIRAQAAFSDWRSGGDHSVAEVARRLSELVMTGLPYARTYQTVEREFPTHLDQVHARLRAELAREGSPRSALIEGEGTPGLTIAGGGGHA